MNLGNVYVVLGDTRHLVSAFHCLDRTRGTKHIASRFLQGIGRLRVAGNFGRSPYGTFAERALAANWMCIPLPEGLDDVIAAGIANPAMSSWAALTGRAKFVAGESVFILGATGVAGQLAVQIAKRLGARRVIAGDCVGGTQRLRIWTPL